jgi:hypothetical protein
MTLETPGELENSPETANSNPQMISETPEEEDRPKTEMRQETESTGISWLVLWFVLYAVLWVTSVWFSSVHYSSESFADSLYENRRRFWLLQCFILVLYLSFLICAIYSFSPEWSSLGFVIWFATVLILEAVTSVSIYLEIRSNALLYLSFASHIFHLFPLFLALGIFWWISSQQNTGPQSQLPFLIQSILPLL